jgi:hypothetical protein
MCLLALFNCKVGSPMPAEKPVSTYALLRGFQDRLSLLVPEAVMKEESLAEGLDQRTARYTLVWYNEPEKNAKVNVRKTVSDLCDQLFGDREDLTYEVGDTQRSVDTSQIMITLENLEEESEREAGIKQAAQPVRPFQIPFVLDFQDNIYRIESRDGSETFVVLRNGDVVEDGCPSVSAAFGKLTKHLLVDLSFAEEISSTQQSLDSIDKDFIESVAQYLANSPVVTKEAAKHLTAFVELVTNRVFEPDTEDAQEEAFLQ